MSTARFTKAELRRALQVIEDEGLSVAVRIEPDGAITLFPCTRLSVQDGPADAFEDWMSKRNARSN